MKKKTKTTKKVIKKNTTKKIKKVSSKKKKELIKAIVNPVRYFKVDFGRYGGEVAMGAITKEQFEYWCGKDEELGTYLSSRGFDPQAANKDVPKEAQFDKEFFEFEDICHTSGPEYSPMDGEMLAMEDVKVNSSESAERPKVENSTATVTGPSRSGLVGP